MTATDTKSLKAKLLIVALGCLLIAFLVVGINLVAEEHLPYAVKLGFFCIVAICIVVVIGCVLALQVVVIRGWLKQRRAP